MVKYRRKYNWPKRYRKRKIKNVLVTTPFKELIKQWIRHISFIWQKEANMKIHFLQPLPQPSLPSFNPISEIIRSLAHTLQDRNRGKGLTRCSKVKGPYCLFFQRTQVGVPTIHMATHNCLLTPVSEDLTGLSNLDRCLYHTFMQGHTYINFNQNISLKKKEGDWRALAF